MPPTVLESSSRFRLLLATVALLATVIVVAACRPSPSDVDDSAEIAGTAATAAAVAGAPAAATAAGALAASGEAPSTEAGAAVPHDAPVSPPLRFRPGIIPSGYEFEGAVERVSQARWPAVVHYDVPSSESVDAGEPVTSSLMLSLSRDDEMGSFEQSAWAIYGTSQQPVDVNGKPAVSLPAMESSLGSAAEVSGEVPPGLFWLEPDGARAALIGFGLTDDEVLTAARGVTATVDGPRIAPEALPAGFEIVRIDPGGGAVRQDTMVKWTSTDADGRTSALNLFVIDYDTGAWSTPQPSATDAANTPGTTPRWDRAQVWSDGGMWSVSWRERPHAQLLLGADNLDEDAVRDFVNGLEVVDEATWTAFLAANETGGIPTPDPKETQVVAVPALSGEPTSAWLERGEVLGASLCAVRWADPLARFQLMLPPFQLGTGLTQIESLSEDERTFDCPR